MVNILIAGASKGIGLEIARQLQAQGHTVIGTSRAPHTAATSDIPLLPLDVTDPASVQACVQQALAMAGHMDVLINNAGYDLYGSAEDTSMDELTHQLDTNFTGAVRLIQAVLPHMRQRRSGKIISLSSIGGRVALPFNSAYSASKFALEGYSESLRHEMLPFNVFVSLIEPAQVNTQTLDTSIRGTLAQSEVYRNEAVVLNARESGRKVRLTPQQVARTVVSVVNTPRPRLRYLVGMQAYSVMWMQQFLPSALFELFISRLFVQPIIRPASGSTV